MQGWVVLVKPDVGFFIVCDRAGAVYEYRPFNMTWAKWEIAQVSNIDNEIPIGNLQALSAAIC